MTFPPLGKQAISLAAINGFFVVAFGAFGAHVLEEKISADMLAIFHTGVQYHMFHVVALVAVGLMSAVNPRTKSLVWCLRFFLAGIILFCGSLYVLALTGIRALGMITPIGGVSFLAGWGLMFFSIVVRKEF